MRSEEWDVVVVGGGHAGAEAAVAASRCGARTLLVTLDPAAVGRMSCNPSIGGLAKGQIVRELDALGGLMGKVADRSAIHFRLLNRSKGPAVQSPRTQNDRDLYAGEVQRCVREAGVTIMAGEVADLDLRSGAVRAVLLASGRRLVAAQVVLTTGTFLGGVLHVGDETREGGRLGEGAAHALGQRLRDAGFRMGRMKTGTPPRFRADSIDWKRTDAQPSDDPPVTFAFSDEPLPQRRVSCAITHTGCAAHRIIDENLDRSPLFSGRITGTGPRYCPSIEDKIHRFPDRDAHRIFLEPEGLDSELVYPNGISTSLPADVQERFVRTIPALESVVFAAHGYAVEYDHLDPTECGPTLETLRVEGLFLAGQINGTTGYEEAAGQGFLAGVNAAHRALGRAPLVLARHEAYIGVLIDDLVTRGVDEPYRMFTSLAEHRLLLRHQDADVRLWPRAAEVGILGRKQAGETERRVARRAQARLLLGGRRTRHGDLSDSLRAPDFGWQEAGDAEPRLEELHLDARDRDELMMEARYAGYIAREQGMIERRRDAEATPIPAGLPFDRIPHLRAEAREKLERVRPVTLGQASRISGLGPADVGALQVFLRTWGAQEGASR